MNDVSLFPFQTSHGTAMGVEWGGDSPLMRKNTNKQVNGTSSVSGAERHHTHIIKAGLTFGRLEVKYNHHNSLSRHRANQVYPGLVREAGCVWLFSSRGTVTTPGLEKQSGCSRAQGMHVRWPRTGLGWAQEQGDQPPRPGQ